MSKQYGLIIPGQQKKDTIRKTEVSKPSIFNESSDSDEDANKLQPPKRKLICTGPSKMDRRKALNLQTKALAEDPTIFQYDELYDEIEAKRDEKKESASKEPKKAKYINRLMEFAEKRKLENELRIERQVQKEREEEGDTFKDKDAFVTSSYRKKLEDMRKLQEQEQRDEYLEAIGDVTKQGDLDGFYRHLYEQKLGPNKKETKTNSTEKPIISNHKQRTYRSKKDSDDEEEDVVDPDKADVTKKVHLHNNLDADSDFSIDSSDEDEEDEEKISKSSQLAKDQNKIIKLDSSTIALNLNSICSTESPGVTEKEVKEEIIEEKPQKQIVVDIWKKRTVGDVFDAAVIRYFQRKAARSV